MPPGHCGYQMNYCVRKCPSSASSFQAWESQAGRALKFLIRG